MSKYSFEFKHIIIKVIILNIIKSLFEIVNVIMKTEWNFEILLTNEKNVV